MNIIILPNMMTLEMKGDFNKQKRPLKYLKGNNIPMNYVS